MRETAKAGELDTHKNGKCKHVKDTEALNQRQKTTTMRGGHPLTGSPARLCSSKGSKKNRKTPHKSCSISTTYVKKHTLF